mgnify:CR=1 FL=1|jgi:hypothetical protein|tara:strand:+ start:1216 stop:2349 length:1134 start_codon:yes stop_codon:yes gene_type:complete
MTQTKVEAPFVQNNIPFRNIAINGGMQVAQRSTSATGLGASAGYFTLDRFDMYFQNTAGRLTMSQTAVTDLPGFTQCLKLDCTTADTSIAAAENAVLQYQVEGQHLQHLKKGTSSAEKTTLSFYVKGDQAATYTCELADKDNTRQNTQTFSVTTSWNRVVLVFDGDTTGAYDNDNAKSLAIQIHLQAGSNSTSGTFTSNTWAANTDANTVKSDQTQFFDSTDRELFITGFQYEVGDAATDFEHLPHDVQLQRCQRYCRLLKMQGIHYTYQFSTNWSRANPTYGNVANEMRDLPSASWLSATPTYDDASQTVAADENKFRWGYNGATNDTSPSSTLGIDNIGFYSLSVYNNAINHSTDGSSGFVIWAKQSAIVLDAEL